MSSIGRTALRSVVGVVAVALMVVGCAKDEVAVDHPDGSIRLVMNQPTSVDELTVVVSNLSEESVALTVGDGVGTNDVVGLDLGASVEAKGRTFTLVEIELDADPGEGDGGDESAAWVVVE